MRKHFYILFFSIFLVFCFSEVKGSVAVSSMQYTVSSTQSATNILQQNNNFQFSTINFQLSWYTSFSRPAIIEEDAYKVAFDYNDAGERTKMGFYAMNNLLFTRYYLGGNYEKEVDNNGVTTAEHLYIGGSPYSAPAVYSKENGEWKLYYLHRDYLGSIRAISDEAGNKTDEYSYDAWGRLRNPVTGENYNRFQQPALRFNRGYTGHEHLPWFGLINMNARLYDPILGRFLSPDPYVQAPFWSQNFNRYSYAANNPLLYVDENGEWFWIPVAIGAAIGAVSGAIIADNVGAQGFLQWAHCIFSGAVIGSIAGGSGVTVGTSVGITVSGGYGGLIGATVGGAVAGSINGFGMGGLAGANPFETIWKGGLAGLVGGGVGGYVSGPLGAVLGGATAGATGAALNKGSFGDIIKSAVLGGLLSYAGYELSMYGAYLAAGGKENTLLPYSEYRKLSIAIQRSFGRRQEVSFAIDESGNVRIGKFGTKNSCTPVAISGREIGGHTHPNLGGGWREPFGIDGDAFHMKAQYLNPENKNIRFMAIGRQNIYITNELFMRAFTIDILNTKWYSYYPNHFYSYPYYTYYHY